jgi:hypothetical protein
MPSPALDVSILLPFGDDEDIVGRACGRLAVHLRALGLRFELLAVDEDCGDNSHTLLALLRAQIPELEILYGQGRDRGYATAAQRARGRVVWLISPEAALRHLAPFARAFRRIDRGELDAVLVERRFAVCHRTRSLDALRGCRGRRFAGLRRRLDGNRVETIRLGATRAPRIRGNRITSLIEQFWLARRPADA